MRDRTRLCHSVTLANITTQPLHAGARQMFIERGGAAENSSQFRQIVIIDYGVLTKCKHDWRHEVRQRDAVVLNGLQKRFELKARDGHNRGTLVKTHVQDHDQSVNMEERQDTD